MNRLISTFFSFLWMLLAGVSGAVAQKHSPALPAPLAALAYKTGTPGWLVFKKETNIHPLTIFETHGEAFGLGEKDEMRLQKTTYDDLGYGHFQYQWYREGLEVEHAIFHVHARQGKVLRANGFLPGIGGVATPVSLSPEAAIQAALNHLQATAYMWEDAAHEAIIRQAKNDPDASFFPIPQLMLTDTDFKWNTPEYRVAYKLEVFTAEPHGCHWVYVDAQSGAILKSLNVTQPTDVEGTALTRYSGIQTMTTDSFENGYRLREYSRAASGIETYDLNRTENLAAAVDFVDADNYWDNTIANDHAANDVHWGSQRVFDYFWETYGRNSFDDNGGKILSYAHYGNNYNNAFWNVFYAGYGDGPGNNLPQTALDIVGHEITHGIIRNAAGNLIYIDESGSLNEAYADIFGNVVEHYVDPADLDWRVGEDCGAIRSMSNPNAFGYSVTGGSGVYPDTYKGTGWYSGDADNGGAHLNSTVFSHWFYRLAEGGTGVNDRGHAFQVDGIGIEAAAAIAYRNLTTYLTPTGQFADARQGTISSAEDLYGVCSPQAIATRNAWHAVGLGFPVLDDDFGVLAIEPIESCGEGPETVSIQVKYYGCEPVLPAFLQVAYFLQGTSLAVVEVMTFADTVRGGDVIPFTFQTPLSLSGNGQFALLSRTLSGTDPYQNNDSSAILTFFRSKTTGALPLTFEGAAASLDSVQFFAGAQAQVGLVAGAGEGSSTGIRMEGGNGSFFRFVEAFPLWGGPDVDPFAYNPAYSSKACLCVDARDMSGVVLSFDLKQHFSSRYAFHFNNSVEETGKQVNNLRVLAGGTELARYQALTRNQDPFTTHHLDLSPWAGSVIPVCFEGKTVQSQAFDTQGIGDRIFIDNLRLTDITAIAVPEPIRGLRVYPNPGAGLFRLEISLDQAATLDWSVLDALGRNALRGRVQQAAGSAVHELDLRALPAGLYLLTVGAEGGGRQSLRLVQE